MKNIKQIELIQKALAKEKDKHISDLAKLVKYIDNKIENIRRMTMYQNEYDHSENLQLTKSVPVLNKNLCVFSGKISEMIVQTEIELAGLERSKLSLLQLIEKVENKIRIMDIFEDRARLEAFMQADRQEQNMIDDLTSIKHTQGNEYE